MRQMIGVVKQAALAAVEAEKPVNVVFGKVAQLNPTKIKLQATGTPLGTEFFFALSDLPNLYVGDILVLLREQGGQRFVILGKKGAL